MRGRRIGELGGHENGNGANSNAYAFIRDLVFTDGMTMLLITHDLDFAKDVADRILFMDAGRIAVSGTPDEVFASDHPLIRQFTSR